MKQKAGWLDVPKILPYRGYGNETDVFIQGMVIEDKGLSKPKDSQRFWQNLISTLKRFSSDEIPGVRIKAEFMGAEQIKETDDMGYFDFHFHFEDKQKELLTKSWQTIHFELLDEIVEDQPHIYATGEARIISPDEKRIIISDIDDTVMVSHATQTLRKLRLMLFKNALTRVPFRGVVEFYDHLVKGKDRQQNHPLFFVSSSEWNLYDLLEDFFSVHRLPKGVLLLRRLNNSIYKFWKSGGGNHDHKYEKIKTLLNFYPSINFILIGDSGQRDPMIYTRLAKKFPHRVEAIYIRRIRSRSYIEENENIYEQMASVSTAYLEVQSTQEAADHAAKQGYVTPEAPDEL